MLTLIILSVVAFFLIVAIAKKSPTEVPTPQQVFLQSPPSVVQQPAVVQQPPVVAPSVEDEHAKAVALIGELYREKKQSEFRASVLRDLEGLVQIGSA